MHLLHNMRRAMQRTRPTLLRRVRAPSVMGFVKRVQGGCVTSSSLDATTCDFRDEDPDAQTARRTNIPVTFRPHDSLVGRTDSRILVLTWKSSSTPDNASVLFACANEILRRLLS